MQINKLKLTNFRNFRDKIFTFKKGINLIVAPNGKGKTNILEAIRTLSYGKPIFTEKESDIINFDNCNENLVYTKILTEWKDYEGVHNSSYTLSPNLKPIKSLTIDSQKLQRKNFVGRFCTVWFSPETINVITASPKYRRELLDIYLCQLSLEYILALTEYNESLDARNRFLKNSNGLVNVKFLEKYDDILSKRACTLIEIKTKLCLDLKSYVDETSSLQNRYHINWNFLPNVEKDPIFDENMENTFRQKLIESREKDIILKRTNIGPHRDDWTIQLKDKESGVEYDLQNYGSRGQKRMGLLIFTLAIVNILEKEKGSKPILLLDDVISELDSENVGLILNMLNTPEQQSVITSTSKDTSLSEGINLIELK
jgi:DNA replication and repair protein RecF